MVQIITDSSVMYTEDEAKAMGFEAIPLCIHIGDLEGQPIAGERMIFPVSTEISPGTPTPMPRILPAYSGRAGSQILSASHRGGAGCICQISAG